MIAASAGRDVIVSLLIDSGADVNSTNEGGQTSLHYAASRNRYEVTVNCKIKLTHSNAMSFTCEILVWP